MEIRPFTPRYQNYTAKNRTFNPAVTQPQADVVSFSRKLPKVLFPEWENLTLEKYQNFPFLDKLTFKMFTPRSIKRHAKLNFYAAQTVRKKFDESYGAANYTVLIVGRSMATVGETMRLMGRDVRFLPMSGLTDGLPERIKDIDVYKKYLDSIFLTRELIESNPEHKFLLLDYVCSGESLRSAHRFLTRPDLLGNPERINMVPSTSVLGTNIRAKKLEFLFWKNGLKDYSPVQSLNMDELSKTFERVKPEPYWQNYRNLFLFHTMGLLDKFYKKQTGR